MRLESVGSGSTSRAWRGGRPRPMSGWSVPDAPSGAGFAREWHPIKQLDLGKKIASNSAAGVIQFLEPTHDGWCIQVIETKLRESSGNRLHHAPAFDCIANEQHLAGFANGFPQEARVKRVG
jgi:hypothetical protein